MDAIAEVDVSGLLVKNASLVVTMDASRRELTDCDILIHDGVVAEVGSGLEAPDVEVLDATGCLVTPGLVNTHNHAFGTLFRSVPHLHRVHSNVWIAGLVRALDGRILSSDAMYAAAMALYSPGARLQPITIGSIKRVVPGITWTVV
jgi:cytosine/adenosine deaminase-related metal-dependent hydrolase